MGNLFVHVHNVFADIIIYLYLKMMYGEIFIVLKMLKRNKLHV